MSRSWNTLCALALVAALAPAAARATYYLRDDATGGDCTLVGTWDADTRTCTLATDLAVVDPATTPAIWIVSPNLVLDGAGHRLIGSGSGSSGVTWGIRVEDLAGVTVRNVAVEGFEGGVFAHYYSQGFTLEDSTITGASWTAVEMRSPSGARFLRNRFLGNGQALRLDGGAGYVVQENRIDGTYGQYGFIIYHVTDSLFERNVLSGRLWAVALTGAIGYYDVYPSRNIVLRDNTFSATGTFQVDLAVENAIYNNDFLDGASRPYEIDEYGGFTFGGNAFNLPAPVGGNYFADHPCTDANADGFCDDPVILAGASDALPWTIAGGWKDGDADGSARALDCDDADASIHPGAVEIPYDGVDQNCNGLGDDDDLDRDGFPLALDCNDRDASIQPGAAEVKGDGVDQDCNGFDLTITVVRATFTRSSSMLRVEATSALGAGAALEVKGIAPMKWDALSARWVVNVKTAQPATVAVCGREGCAAAAVVPK